MKQTAHYCRAFTLLELMVSVLIVTGLAFLAFHGMRSLTAKSTLTRCCNNLRQIGVGIAAYAVEHRGEWPYDPDNRDVPLRGTWISRTIKDEGKWLGLGQIFPYVRDKRIFVCPANKTSLAVTIKRGDFASEEGSFPNSYSARGFNQSYNPSRPDMRSLATIGYRALVSCNFAYAPVNPVNFPLSWHDGIYPVLFSDGSVSTIRLPDGAVNTQSPPNINNSTSMQMRVWDYFDGKTTTLQL